MTKGLVESRSPVPGGVLSFRLLRAHGAARAVLARILVPAVIGGTIVVAAGAATSATPSGPLYIDAGGDGGTDADGHDWIADSYFTGGQANTTSDHIDGTRYQNIFRDWRRDPTAYHIPLNDGTYWVKVLESETYWNEPDQRVFDVTAEGRVIFDNVDIFERAGGADEALYLVSKVTVTDGRL